MPRQKNLFMDERLRLIRLQSLMPLFIIRLTRRSERMREGRLFRRIDLWFNYLKAERIF